jgi:hypothetical protein
LFCLLSTLTVMMKLNFLLFVLTIWSVSAAAQDVKGSIDYADGDYQYICRVKKAPNQYELIIDLPSANGALERVHEGVVLVTGQMGPGGELKVTIYQSLLKQGRWVTDRTSFMEASHRTGNDGPTYYHEGNLAKLAEKERTSNFSAEMATLKPTQAIRLTVEYFIINYSRAIPTQAQKLLEQAAENSSKAQKNEAVATTQKDPAAATDKTNGQAVSKLAQATPQEGLASANPKVATATSSQPSPKAEKADQDHGSAGQTKPAQDTVAATQPEVAAANQKAPEAKADANEPAPSDQPGQKVASSSHEKTSDQVAGPATQANPVQGAPQEAVVSSAKVLPGEAPAPDQSAQTGAAEPKKEDIKKEEQAAAQKEEKVEVKKEEKTPEPVAKVTTPTGQEPGKGFVSGSSTQTGGFIDQLEQSGDETTTPKPDQAAPQAAEANPKPAGSEPAPENASQAKPGNATQIVAVSPAAMTKPLGGDATAEEAKPATPKIPMMPASLAPAKDSAQKAQPDPGLANPQPAAETLDTLANLPAPTNTSPKKAALAMDGEQFSFITQTLKLGSETFFVVPEPVDNKQGRFYFKLEHYLSDSNRTENRYNSYLILCDSTANANKYDIHLHLSIEDKYGQVQGYPCCYLNCTVDLAEGVVRYQPISKMKEYRDPAAPEQEVLTSPTGQISHQQLTELAFKHFIAHYSKLFSN